jgi:Lantibiotic biosynthesis dehydratase C-term
MDLWKSLRISYYAPEKDGLYLEGVVPAVERLLAQGAVTRWYCQRHWLHGPHLRAVVALASEAVEGAVRATLEQQARGYLERHPSTSPLGEEEYLRRYAPIGVLEQVSEHPLPLQPDNSMWWEEAVMAEASYGGRQGVLIARDFLAASQETITEVVRRTVGNMPERLFRLARLLLAFCASFKEPAFAALSFRSHAEAYYHGVPNGAQLRKRFEASYLEQEQKLLRVLEEAEAGRVEPLLRGWMDAIRTGYERAAEAARTGELQLPDREDYAAMESRLPEGLSPELLSDSNGPSPYHAPLVGRDSPYAWLFKTPNVQGRRLILNMVYNKLQLTGIRPLERLFLCSVVAQTAERRYGDWQETARAFVNRERP